MAETENPGTVYPEKGILRGLISSGDPQKRKEAEEISDRILEAKTEFEPEEDLTLYVMAEVYRQAGDEGKKLGPKNCSAMVGILYLTPYFKSEENRRDGRE